MADETHATPRFNRTLFEGGFAGHAFDQAMLERNDVSQRRLEGPSAESGPGWVRIIHGANEGVMPVGGQTVGRVRHELGGLFNIAPDADAFLSGQPVAEDRTLRHGEELEFIKLIGRKGMGRVWTGEEFCKVFKIGGADLVAMIAKGLPVHRMEDGSIRITETQVDAFLDRISAGKDHAEADRGESSFSVLTPLIAEVRRIADALDPPPPDVLAASIERPVARRPASLTAVPTPPEEGTALADAHTIPPGGPGTRALSPYLDAEEAAAYLGVSLGSLYGIVERGRLVPLRGPRRRYRFTTVMLDEYLKRKGGVG